MQADLAIINGLLVDSKRIYRGVLTIKDGKIWAITQNLDRQAKEIIDAQGLFVLPGAIDGHVHMMDPGFLDREDFITGTSAAARGGVTTVVDHHRNDPPVFAVKEFREKKEYLKNRSLVDFGLLAGLSLDNLSQLPALWKAGALGFKGFTCELHGADALTSRYLMRILEEIHHFQGIALLHCEDDGLLKKREEELRQRGRKDPLLIKEWRSPEAEELAVQMVLYLAQLTRARVAIAHVSQASLVEKLAAARQQGSSIYIETCPQYLWLCEEDLPTLGPWGKFTPPPRQKEDVAQMRWWLSQGVIDMVNSDHCPYPYAAKEAGRENIWLAPFGIPGVETTTILLLDLVSRGILTLPQMVYVRSERPAEIYGLLGQKGILQVGADADLIFVDLSKKRVLHNREIVSKCGWTPYHGQEVNGDVVLTMVRGKVVMKEGKIVGEPGWGRFITRR